MMSARGETLSGEQQRVAVLAPGAVGGLLAALLARRGHFVACIARRPTVEILQRDGLSLQSELFGGFTVAVGACSELSQPVSACLVAVKGPDLESALQRLPPDLMREGLVVPFLNGIEHVSLLRDRYGAGRVAPATIRVETTLKTMGTIRQLSPFASIELSSSTAPADRVAALSRMLIDAGLTVTVRTDETNMLWEKLCFLAPLALLTTEEQGSIGVVRQSRGDDLVSLVNEVTSVSRAVGAAVDGQRILQLLQGLPETMRSSMEQDASAGHPFEIEEIGGAVIRAARQHGLAIPVTTRVVDAIRTRYGTSRHSEESGS